MKSPLPFGNAKLARTIAYGWRHGELAARAYGGAVGVLLLVLTVGLWHSRPLHGQIPGLEARAAKLQTELETRSAAIQAAQPPDFVRALPDAPSVAQVMQTLQQAADKEGARVESLQADDHPPTDSALGHLDLVVSIKATYPAILVVLQQTLDRYPGATVRQLSLVHSVAPTAMMPMAPAPMGGATSLPPASQSEARVLLSFWRRPVGVARATEALAVAAAASASSAPLLAASALSVPASAVAGLGAAATAPAAGPASGAR